MKFADGPVESAIQLSRVALDRGPRNRLTLGRSCHQGQILQMLLPQDDQEEASYVVNSSKIVWHSEEHLLDLLSRSRQGTVYIWKALSIV